MEELKGKTFLLKVRSDLFDFLKSGNKNEKVGKVKVFLNKKRDKPEYTFVFNKEKEPKKFSLSYSDTSNFIWFKNEEPKDGGIKINNIDSFGNLIIKEEDKANDFLKNIYSRENDKTKEIQIKEVKDREKKYVQHEEIKLSSKPFAGRDKKDKKIRIDDNELIEYVKKEVKNNNFVSPKYISDKYEVPEVQVKTIMEKICDKIPEGNRKCSYKLKPDYED